MFHDQQTDADAERTITLSQRDVLAARRLLKLLLSNERASLDELLRPPATHVDKVDRGTLTARARAELHNRRRRVALFGQSIFGEPAWDMLLVLYILDDSGQRQTMGSLFQYSGYSPSTAKRWLDYLAAHDLIRRDDHPTDRRTAFISLTIKARDWLDLYYSETIETVV